MTETAYQILFRGFDCLVAPTEEGMFHVSLFEEGAHVFDTDVPIDLSQFETDEEIDDNSNALINEAAQAAVDEFEASRGSLGQGAGVGKMATKKTAYWASMDYADWYCTLKATSFKDQAESLLEQYFAAQRDQSCGNQEQAQARRMAEQKLAQLEYELNMLNLQRMKCAKPNETIIVIKSFRLDKEACGSTLEEFIDGFRGTKFEDEALMKMKDYLATKKQLEAAYETSNSNWKALDDIRQAMDELFVDALQKEVSDSVVDNSGVGIDSNMAADVMSLMDGVTLSTDFETTNEMPPALFANKRAVSDKLRDQENPNVFGYDLDRETLTPIKRKLPPIVEGEDYGCDPMGDGTFKMVPSGDIVDAEEMHKRLDKRKWSKRFAQDSAYIDEPSRPMDDVLQDALAMVKSMKRSDPATIKNTIKTVYGLSDKDAADLVSYGKRGKRAQSQTKYQQKGKWTPETVKPLLADLQKYDPHWYELEQQAPYGFPPSYAMEDELDLWWLDEGAEKLDEMEKELGKAKFDSAYKKWVGTDEDLADEDLESLNKSSKRAEKEDKDEEHEVVELGEIHEGIDPAEVPMKELPFALGDKVTLSKAYEMPIWGGGTTELAKGTKGVIESLYDGHGNAYMICCAEGGTYCVPTEYLK